jgi:hypothetical protein
MLRKFRIGFRFDLGRLVNFLPRAVFKPGNELPVVQKQLLVQEDCESPIVGFDGNATLGPISSTI